MAEEEEFAGCSFVSVIVRLVGTSEDVLGDRNRLCVCCGEERMTVMLSSHGIGLITVIAVSGCSVMLLVLGRQKLLEAKKEENSVENPKDSDCALGSLSSVDKLETFSFPPRNGSRGGGSISWRINFDISETSAESQENSPKMPKSACKALRKPSPEKGGNSVKKVRFSDDVVEPSGNNTEYRRRHALASRSGQQKSPNAHNSQSMSSDSPNFSEKKRTPVKTECRMQTLEKPSMPPNRRALYNGIFHDRAQRSLLY